jgi:hypothetical protein
MREMVGGASGAIRYQDALKDPTLRRTRQELEVALDNARTAREVVFELFQDLDSFRLDDYRQFDDSGKGMKRLLHYVQAGVQQAGGTVAARGPTLYEVTLNGEVPQRLSGRGFRIEGNRLPRCRRCFHAPPSGLARRTPFLGGGEYA